MLHFIYMASKAHARHCSLTITGNTKDPNDDDALWKINYNADRTTDVVVNEHFCRWEVHTEKPSVAPSSSPSFLPSLRPSDSPSLAVSDNMSDISIENEGQDSEPNISNAGILLSVFVYFHSPRRVPHHRRALSHHYLHDPACDPLALHQAVQVLNHLAHLVPSRLYLRPSLNPNRPSGV